MYYKIIFALFAGVLVAGMIGTVVLMKSIDLTPHRDFIAAQIRQVTGRELTLAGQATLAVSLTPRIVIEDVTLANAEWGSRPKMLVAKRLEAEIRLLPLVTGDVDIVRLVLIDPDILIETDTRGRGNWMLVGPTGATVGAAVAIPAANEILMTGARVEYRDGTTGETSELIVDRFSARADTDSGPLVVAFAGAYNGNPISAEGTLGPTNRRRGSQPYRVSLRGEAGGAMLTIEGRIRRPSTMSGFDLLVTAEGGDLSALSPFVGYEIPALGAYEATLRLTDADGGFQIAELSARIGSMDRQFLTLSGSVRDPFALAGLDIAFTLEGRDLATLGALGGVDLAPGGPVRVTGNVTDFGRIFSVNAIEATLGESDLAGNLAIDTAGPRTRVIAELTSSLLDVGALFRRNRSIDIAKAREGTDDGVERLFSDTPLPIAPLKTIDAKLAVRAGRVRVEGTVLDNVVADLSLDDGALDLRVAEARHGDSELTAGLSVDARGSTPVVAAWIDATNLDVGHLFAELHVTELIDGKGDLSVDVRGKGDSLRAIMGALDGRASLIMGAGHVNSERVDLLAADLLQSIAPWEPDEEVTKFNCLVGRFDVKDGIATSENMLFDTQRMTIAGEGEIDLGAEELDLVLVPKPKDPSLISLATPIRVRGKLMDPSVAPDALAVARTTAGAVIGAIATGGIGLIVPFVSVGSADDDPCIAALAGPDTEAVASGEAGAPARTEDGTSALDR